MSVSLQGHKVLVTRPQHQAENLCRLIDEADGKAILLPALDITLSENITELTLRNLISESSHIIFVSRNAVLFTARLVDELALCLRDKSIIAVGNGTMQELANKGVVDVISPGPRSGSETLLALDIFRQENIEGEHVLIIRGSGGREFLKDGLEANGAFVRYAEIYQRLKPDIEQTVLESLWQDDAPDVIVFTSNQSLLNMLDMCKGKNRDILLGTRTVVMSERISKLAASSGFIFPAIVATEQSDQGLIQAIGQCVELIRNEC